MTYSITNIQFFNLSKEELDSNDNIIEVAAYSANITINDCFIVQVSGNANEAEALTIPRPELGTFWNSEADQMSAYEKLDASEIEAAIEEAGFENNFGWLEDAAHEVA